MTNNEPNLSSKHLQNAQVRYKPQVYEREISSNQVKIIYSLEKTS